MVDLSRLVTPQSVALIGASATPGAPGRHAMENLVRHSRIPQVHLVNPGRKEIDGHPCVASIDELPMDEIDIALVIVGATSIVECVEQCARRGVKFAIVPGGGLAELGESGRAEQDRLHRIKERYGIRIYGPNCPGLTNVNDGVIMSVSPSARLDTLGGRIGLITQGGALGRTVMQYMDRGVGIGCWLSAGNEVDLELSDFVAHLAADDRIAAIACVIEGFQDGPRFLRAAESAGMAGKPILAMVLGRTESGAIAAQSHTAHLATTSRVVRSVLRQHGVTVVEDIDELVEQSALFARGPAPEPLAPCVMTFSGGAAVAAVDALELAGIAPARLSPPTRTRLEAALPAFGTAANPLDLTMDVMRHPEIATKSIEALRLDDAINSLVVPIPGDYGDITARFVQEVLAYESPERPERRVVAVWSSPRRGKGCAELESRGILPFSTTTGMARGLANAVAYRRWRGRRLADSHMSAAQTRPPAELGDPISTPWTEFQAKELISAQGIHVPRSGLVRDRSQAADVAVRIGFPVAMKIQSCALPHKTEAGGVALGVASVEGVLASWDAIIESARAAGVEPDRIDGVLIEQMAPAGTDLIISARYDPAFGRISAIGLGGIFTETLADVVFVTGAPSTDDLAAALRNLAAWPVLAGARGRRPIDVASLAALVGRLDGLLASTRGIAEIEINPLRATDDGELLALDALVQSAGR